MYVIDQIRKAVCNSVKRVYQLDIHTESLTLNETKPEFEGDYTLVTFSLSKLVGKKPDEIAALLGNDLVSNDNLFSGYNVIKGFLNLSLHTEIWLQFLQQNWQNPDFFSLPSTQQKVMVEYSSPNTNKPLHFGHLRNIFLGSAISNILQASGQTVIKTNLINDRGIHICKSMIAWQRYGKGATPENTGIKGDHLVGDYYVKFNDVYKAEVEELIQSGIDKELAEKQSPILLAAQALLRQWEAGDPETLSLWNQMNAWVYAGFDITYKKLGVDFDKVYHESETYLLGKTIIEKGLAKGVLFRKEDQSVWIDLSAEGLDQKLLLRGDGTSVYITQDIGTANVKYADYQMDQSVYVIGDEQNYHMQVLKLIMQKLSEPGADGIYHLSYGMVELPSGKMKSREGTVVDADDMIAEMVQIAQKNTEELGKVDGFSEEELQQLYQTLGLGALKFYLLRVDPKKKMIFNPQESIDFHGFTGPFIQYTYARICSILRKSGDWNHTNAVRVSPDAIEKGLIQRMEQYPLTILQAAKELNPSHICNYLFMLAKEYNGFLTEHSVLKAEEEQVKVFRLQLSTLCKRILQQGMQLLGTDVPERM